MNTGSSLQINLSTIILLNWRSYKFVYTADIAKMYRQILVNLKDVQYQRILWHDSPTLRKENYCLVTVTNGTRSAPFLALRTFRQLVKDDGNHYPHAAEVLLDDTFVDDLLFGGHDKPSALNLRKEVSSLLQRGHFQARKWSSNSQELLADINPSDHGLACLLPLGETEGVTILGINWSPKTDLFGFKVSFTVPETFTKRTVLSLVAKLFDPLG